MLKHFTVFRNFEAKILNMTQQPWIEMTRLSKQLVFCKWFIDPYIEV